ncbi:MAG TPA: hypothetical protein VK422_09535 [Pyrinomonadaceae bacterium]|nr:hypothetical protein [Pyrinomonadaceae bacterium]
MKRRIFLAFLAAALLCGTALAQEAPSDGVGRVTVEELKALLAGANPPFVIDVRSGPGRVVKGAVVIPVDQVESRLSEVPRDREVITYCA